MTSDGAPAALVGRDHERQRLEAALVAAQRGIGRLLVLAGEAGIGKSRLAEEIAASAAGAGLPVRWGRCRETGAAPPFWPWMQSLRRQLAGSDPAQLQRHFAAVADLFTALLPEYRGVVTGPTAPPDDPIAARFQLIAALASWLLHSAGDGGLLLILEDVQWADASSLLLLRALAEDLGDTPLLLLATYRDTEIDRAHPLSETLAALLRLPHSERLFLGGLGRQEVGALIAAAGGVVAVPALTETVYHVTEGNPFFVIELARLVAGGGDLPDPRRSIETPFTVPQAIREVIERRLARLTATCEQVLDVAAVIGEEFGVAALEAASDLPREALLQALDEAEQARLLTAVPGVVGRYRFSHVLTRETIDRGLSGATRMRLHARVGAAVEQVWARDLDPHLAELARHYARAAPLGHAEQAVDYLLRAAAQAERLLSFSDAIGHYEAALALLDEYGGEPQRRAELLERLGEALLLARYDWPGGIARLEAALALYVELGRDDRTAGLHVKLGRYLSAATGVQDLPRALDHFRAARTLLDPGDNTAISAQLALGLAQAGFFTMQLEELSRNARLAVEIGRKAGEPAIEAEAMAWLSGELGFRGRQTEARGHANDAWMLADRAGAFQAAFISSWFAAAMDLFGGDPRMAVAGYQRELDQPRSTHVASQRAFLLMMSAVSAAEAGDLDDARRRQRLAQGGTAVPPSWFPGSWVVSLADGDWAVAAEQVTAFIDSSERAGDFVTQRLALFHLAPLAEARGDHQRAEAALREALEMSVSDSEPLPQIEMNGRPQLARLCAASGRLDEARRHIARCNAILAEGEDWRGLVGRVAFAEAALAVAEGRTADAERDFARALASLQRYCLVWDEAALRLAWGEALAASGDTTRAEEQFAAAAAVYTRIGAGAPWLERAARQRDAALGTMPARAAPLDRLTAREIEVLRLLARGLSNPEIAGSLVLSVHTVERHAANIYGKLGLAGRAEAIALAYRHDLT